MSQGMILLMMTFVTFLAIVYVCYKGCKDEEI